MCDTIIGKNMILVVNHSATQNGSTQNGTVREAGMLAAIRNRLYLCSAFETQVQDIEY